MKNKLCQLEWGKPSQSILHVVKSKFCDYVCFIHLFLNRFYFLLLFPSPEAVSHVQFSTAEEKDLE